MGNKPHVRVGAVVVLIAGSFQEKVENCDASNLPAQQ